VIRRADEFFDHTGFEVHNFRSKKNINTTPTMGQELMDLKKAKDQGLISESEFEEAKEDILDKYDD
jgi:hypothetical protein